MTGTTKPSTGVSAAAPRAFGSSSAFSGGTGTAFAGGGSSFGGATNFGAAVGSFGVGSQNSSFQGRASTFGTGAGGAFGSGQGGNFGTGSGGTFGAGAGGTFGTGQGGTFGDGQGGPSGAIQVRGSSLSSGAIQERGSSLSSGAIRERGSSLSSGAIRERGSSFSSGAIQERGSSLSSGAIRERGSSFSRGSIRASGTAFGSGSSKGRAFSSGGGKPLKMGVKRTRAKAPPVFVRTKFGDEVAGKLILTLEQEYDERGNLKPVKILQFSATMNGKDITPTNHEPWMVPRFGTLTVRDHDRIGYYSSKQAYSDDCQIWLNRPYEYGRVLGREKVTVIAAPGSRSAEHYFGPPGAGESIFLSPNLQTKTKL